MLLPLSRRQEHLKLDEPCIERGGRKTTISIHMRGVLSFVFDTTIPKGMKLCYACHACNNWKCSNIKHVYWGSPRENLLDARTCGARKTGWEYSVAKHGVEEAKKLCNGWKKRKTDAGSSPVASIKT